VREAIWAAPFLCIALASFGLVRLLPRFPAPPRSRTVVDAGGTPVRIAMPFRGIVLAPNSFPSTYLEDTHAPELLVYAGNVGLRRFYDKGVMNWVYPEVLNNAGRWNDRLFRDMASPYTEIESLVAFDPSVYVGCGGPEDLVRRVGLPVFNCGSAKGAQARAHALALLKDVGCGDPPNPRRTWYPEGYLFPGLRSYAALVGRPELAERNVAEYCQEIVQVREELQGSAFRRPRVWAAGEEPGNFSRAGMVNAEPPRFRGDNPEELLAMDPDVIFLVVGSPREFNEDARHQGLKAIRDRRVYRRPGNLEWWTTGLNFKPMEIRWMAELAHPDRLQPKLRQMLRDHVLKEFGYRFSEEQLDLQLHVAENANSAYAERFTRKGVQK
jgi:hypothetical protein